VPRRVGTEREKRILATVRQIPKGKVAAYGEVAFAAGFPRCARQVGAVLSALDPNSRVPWHRVINAKGEVSPRGGDCETDQRARLEAEGVTFNAKGRIDLRRFGWFRG
jgi:methylated-DNA-protein-cysteine methyltransferase related protein